MGVICHLFRSSPPLAIPNQYISRSTPPPFFQPIGFPHSFMCESSRESHSMNSWNSWDSLPLSDVQWIERRTQSRSFSSSLDPSSQLQKRRGSSRHHANVREWVNYVYKHSQFSSQISSSFYLPWIEIPLWLVLIHFWVCYYQILILLPAIIAAITK